MIAIIGGSGLTQLANLEITQRKVVRTPYGEPSGPLTFGRIGESEVVFLARHGYGHTLAPHEVNYRANLWALRTHGRDARDRGGHRGRHSPGPGAGTLAVPHQIIDYTWGRRIHVLRGRRAAGHAHRLHLAVSRVDAQGDAGRGGGLRACRSSTAASTRRHRGRGSRPRPRSTASSATAPTWSA